jgi:hypothetical protein
MTEVGALGIGLVIGWAVLIHTGRASAVAVGVSATTGASGLLQGAGAAIAAALGCAVGLATCGTFLVAVTLRARKGI